MDEPGAPVDGLAACPSPRDCRRVDKAPGQVLHLQTVSHQGLQVVMHPLSLPFRPRFTPGAAYTHHRTLQPSGGSYWLQFQSPEIHICSQPSDLEASATSYKWVSLNQFKSLIIHFLNLYLLPLIFFPYFHVLTHFYDSFCILLKSHYFDLCHCSILSTLAVLWSAACSSALLQVRPASVYSRVWILKWLNNEFRLHHMWLDTNYMINILLVSFRFVFVLCFSWCAALLNLRRY